MSAVRTRRRGLRCCGWQGYVCNACRRMFKTASAYRQHHCR